MPNCETNSVSGLLKSHHLTLWNIIGSFCTKKDHAAPDPDKDSLGTVSAWPECRFLEVTVSKDHAYHVYCPIFTLGPFSLQFQLGGAIRGGELCQQENPDHYAIVPLVVREDGSNSPRFDAIGEGNTETVGKKENELGEWIQIILCHWRAVLTPNSPPELKFVYFDSNYPPQTARMRPWIKELTEWLGQRFGSSVQREGNSVYSHATRSRPFSISVSHDTSASLQSPNQTQSVLHRVHTFLQTLLVQDRPKHKQVSLSDFITPPRRRVPIKPHIFADAEHGLCEKRYSTTRDAREGYHNLTRAYGMYTEWYHYLSKSQTDAGGNKDGSSKQKLIIPRPLGHMGKSLYTSWHPVVPCDYVPGIVLDFLDYMWTRHGWTHSDPGTKQIGLLTSMVTTRSSRRQTRSSSSPDGCEMSTFVLFDFDEALCLVDSVDDAQQLAIAGKWGL